MPAASTTEGDGVRVLVAGVGYRNLRDFSVGPRAADRLAELDWPADVDVDDLSYNPVAVVHRMAELEHPYRRLILVAAKRRGRRPGSVTTYRWDGRLPAADNVQSRVAEAVTGVIDLDNLLVVLAQFEALPEEVIVVEVEPAVEEWGEGFSREVESGFDDAVEAVRSMALDDETRGVPTMSLGGRISTN